MSDPLEYIQEAKQLDARKPSALLCAGAFPGFSNVLAVEAAHVLGEPVKDLNFSYFTAGLGARGRQFGHHQLWVRTAGPPIVDGHFDAHRGVRGDGLRDHCV